MPEPTKLEIKCPLDAVSVLLDSIQILNVAGTAFFKTAPVEVRNTPVMLRAVAIHVAALNRALQVAEWYKKNLEILEKQFEG